MRLEHIGMCVHSPISMAEWWVANLEFKFLRKLGTDEGGVAFISDDAGTVIELGKLEEVESLDLNQLGFIQLHFAMECDDTLRVADQLVSQGATFIGESLRNAYKNEKVIVKDPWGAYIQLVCRQDKLLIVDNTC